MIILLVISFIRNLQIKNRCLNEWFRRRPDHLEFLQGKFPWTLVFYIKNVEAFKHQRELKSRNFPGGKRDLT